MPSVFSVPIFFIVFRESLEGSIIVSVLLALVEQIVQEPRSGTTTAVPTTLELDIKREKTSDDDASNQSPVAIADDKTQTRALVKKMRRQIFLGSIAGFVIALAIGAAFLAVWFTRLTDLWAANEDVWEGSFNLIASLLIFVMGLTMLRIDKAKAKWRVKLQQAFITGSATTGSRWTSWRPFQRRAPDLSTEENLEMSSSRWTLFLLPFVTVLREGLEAVVFIGGISLGQKATSIPLATICGLICGLGVGFIIYKSSSRTSISIFLVISTNLLLLVGAGLFSKAVGSFEAHHFNKLVGTDVREAGNGPGSYDVRGNIWHLNCCNPEDKSGSSGGWSIFAGIFGWSNNGSLGTVLAYIFYWIAAVVALIIMQITERKHRQKAATMN